MIDRRLAWLSALIYQPWPQVQHNVSAAGLRLAESWDHAGSQGALIAAANGAVIVFRGTEATKLRLRDLWSNLGWPEPWQGVGRVHSGYREHFDAIGFKALRMAEDVAPETPLASGKI